MRHIRRATIILAILITAGCADTVDYVNDNAQKVGAPIFGGAAGVVAGG